MTYKAGDQPDPEFVEFFAGEWQRLINAVTVPGMDNPSWDRKAAYLFWEAERVIPVGGDVRRELPSLWASINHTDDADCLPTPGGVIFYFDARGR